MLSLIVETNRDNKISSHWVLETETLEEAKRRINSAPLLLGNKRIVYTNIEASELAKNIASGGTLYVETAEPPPEKETTLHTEIKMVEFENIYPLDKPINEDSDLIIPVSVAEAFEKRFKAKQYLLGEAGHPRLLGISDPTSQRERMHSVKADCVAIKITLVEVDSQNKTMRIKAIPYGPRQSVCKLTNPGVILGCRGVSNSSKPSVMSEIITFDVISDR